MTEKQFVATSRTMAVGIVTACEMAGIPRHDAALLTVAAAMEALAQLVGPVPAIEKMRDASDLAEQQLLEAGMS
ncbi:hypothetical protein [Novosphingobium sp. KN65.2]|uniref:hypothetical protein n=1 Tax=Novosphingobium sp. KN65.2 TaxID=1478134 RepID=UPI0005DE1E42|nr:hypothetical protein [Novosphingobium sp. KN65.2]CDO36008.1 hypothetical protein SPHV1_2290024 [Novosphingobium sp. KN65.2]